MGTMPLPELVCFGIAIFVIGGLIGSVGVGGLLLTPLLVSVAAMDVREAIAVSMASFIATGCVALWLFMREATPIRHHWPLLVSTMPGALVGALVLWVIPSNVAGVLLALFLVATGVRLLVSRGRPVPTEPASSGAELGIGTATGFLSAITGTGGPMVMVPLLAWRGVPLLTAIALGQLVQLPVSGIATIGNSMRGEVDFALAAMIGVLLMPGAIVGRISAEAMPVGLITRLVALVLIAAGIWLGWRAA